MENTKIFSVIINAVNPYKHCVLGVMIRDPTEFCIEIRSVVLVKTMINVLSQWYFASFLSAESEFTDTNSNYSNAIVTDSSFIFCNHTIVLFMQLFLE